jgi:hypothetical protein
MNLTEIWLSSTLKEYQAWKDADAGDEGATQRCVDASAGRQA